MIEIERKVFMKSIRETMKAARTSSSSLMDMEVKNGKITIVGSKGSATLPFPNTELSFRAKSGPTYQALKLMRGQICVFDERGMRCGSTRIIWPRLSPLEEDEVESWIPAGPIMEMAVRMKSCIVLEKNNERKKCDRGVAFCEGLLTGMGMAGIVQVPVEIPAAWNGVVLSWPDVEKVLDVEADEIGIVEGRNEIAWRNNRNNTQGHLELKGTAELFRAIPMAVKGQIRANTALSATRKGNVHIEVKADGGIVAVEGVPVGEVLDGCPAIIIPPTTISKAAFARMVEGFGVEELKIGTCNGHIIIDGGGLKGLAVKIKH